MDKRYMDKPAFAAFWTRISDMLRARVAKVNGHAPDEAGNVALKAADIGAAAAGHAHTAGQVGAIPTVGGAAEGHVPVFDRNGNLASSGVNFWAYHHLYCNLQGTTLYITTL